MKIAPITLFVYNRPFQTQEVLKSLAACDHAEDAELYIFSDAPKKDSAAEAVAKVREIIHDDQWAKKFKAIHVTMAEKNKGLARSVITGVTQVINEHGCIAVVEDDNRVAKDFIDYMSRGLEFYRDNKQISMIGAYKAPFKVPAGYQHDVFLAGRGSSYSWATWKDRWDLVDWEVKDYAQFKADKAAIARFNEYGEDRAAMLDAQMSGQIDSWAIRFSYAMFKHQKYAILPVQTRIENIGFDGSGVHNVAADTRFLVKIEEDLKPVVFENVKEDPQIKREIVKKFQIPMKIKIKRIVKDTMKKVHLIRG